MIKEKEREIVHIFHKQPHFSNEPQVGIGSAQNEPQSC